MAIGTIFVYHGVETGATDELRCISLERKSFSHENDSIISGPIVKKGEKNLAFTEDGRDSWYVTFFNLQGGDNSVELNSSIEGFNSSASQEIRNRYPDEAIGIA